MLRCAMLALLLLAPATGVAQATTAGASEPFVVEYYYKIRCGYADEFIRLFKKNHFPVLKRQIELGHAQQVSAEAPRFPGTEDGRWDYRVTIVWKNAAAPHEAFPEAELKRSEERRVGKECRSRWSPYREKKKKENIRQA